jgi:hypothetical protein
MSRAGDVDNFFAEFINNVGINKPTQPQVAFLDIELEFGRRELQISDNTTGCFGHHDTFATIPKWFQEAH